MTGNRRDVYREITDSIVAAIEAGAGEFVMPWHGAGLPLERPVNALTQKPYRGANILALWVAAQAKGYGSNYWASFKQWRQLGAYVRKGERGSLIVFYKKVERATDGDDIEEADTKIKKPYLFARASFVFNSDQVDGWSPPSGQNADPVETIDAVEAFIKGTGATIRVGGNQACYWYATDHIQIPHRQSFIGTKTSTPTEAYYATLLHELSHWTGHEVRLKRDLRNRFGDAAYSMEELIAEFGAAFLCAELGITNVPREDHAAYLAHWLRVLKNDRKALFSAATQAASAADFLRSRQEQASTNYGE